MPGQGFAWLMETQPRRRLLQAEEAATEAEGTSGRKRRYYVSFREEDPSARTFVDILMGTTPRHSSIVTAAGRLTPLSCACPGTPLSPFFHQPFCHQIQPERRRDEEMRKEKGAQNTHVFPSSNAVKHSSDTIHPLPFSPHLNSLSTTWISKERNNKDARMCDLLTLT